MLSEGEVLVLVELGGGVGRGGLASDAFLDLGRVIAIDLILLGVVFGVVETFKREAALVQVFSFLPHPLIKLLSTFEEHLTLLHSLCSF